MLSKYQTLSNNQNPSPQDLLPAVPCGCFAIQKTQRQQNLLPPLCSFTLQYLLYYMYIHGLLRILAEQLLNTLDCNNNTKNQKQNCKNHLQSVAKA